MNKYLDNNQNKPKEIYSQLNLSAIKDRWDSRAENWDLNLEDPNCHLNLDDAYRDFINILEEIILANEQFCSNKSCLDIGCGTGIVLNQIISYFNRGIGIDISHNMIKKARKKEISNTKFYEFNCFDILDLNLSFGVLFSRGIIISHYGEELAVELLRKANNILTENGFFVLDFLNEASINEFDYQPQNKVYYNKNKINKLSKKSGFSKCDIYGNKNDRVLVACLFK